MKISELLREDISKKLGELATIKLNFPDADFWIIRKGSEDKVGTPVKEFDPERIGVKVTATDVLLPDYLFYMIQFLQMRGYFKEVSRGSLRLKHIQVGDVSRIPIKMREERKPTQQFGYKDVKYQMNEPKFKK